MGLTPVKTYEDLLGDALETILARGTDNLEDFAGRLNDLNVRGPNGQKWTADLLAAELQRLGE